MAGIVGAEWLTANFRRAEFACQCGCGFEAIGMVLVAELQRLRDQVEREISILSGCRCAKHNAAVGGAPGSQHVLGKAADIRIHGLGPRQIYAIVAADPGPIKGIGVDDERGFVHVDTRAAEQIARWCYDGGRGVAWHEETQG
jgi:uncharacterized protein YcbK (DUF882 family)